MSAKRILLVLGVAVVAAPLALFAGSAYFVAQRADYGWKPSIVVPRFTGERPRVLFDEGHHNASSAGIAGRYWPFARLLRADGFAVERGTSRFSGAQLDGARVLVIANAAGAPKPQFFGINLPIPTDKRRGDPAFTGDEIELVRAWVERGGSLLLIADHAPFGEAAADLAAAFGVVMHKGFVEVPDEPSDPLVFSTENGRLGEHPIIGGEGDGGGAGGGGAARIHRVMTYTGQSLDGPPAATVLLRLPPSAIEGVPEAESFVERRAGQAQGLAFEYGDGRVVVLGEAAMVTAQVNRRVRYGINTGDNDNGRFVLNAMHWLARAS